MILEPATPQNIVIGGASGAMPPVLGWAAVTDEVTTEALLLFPIIYAWTPPHSWALALCRTEEYATAGLPMLPVTHGKRYTRIQVLLYTLILFGVTLLPFAIRMSVWLYLGAACALGGIFIGYAIALYAHHSDRLAHRTFRYSILYLALLVDHYLQYGSAARRPRAARWHSPPARATARTVAAGRFSGVLSRHTTCRPARLGLGVESKMDRLMRVPVF